MARKKNMEERLSGERNVWIATVRPDGRPRLVPVWFSWVENRGRQILNYRGSIISLYSTLGPSALQVMHRRLFASLCVLKTRDGGSIDNFLKWIETRSVAGTISGFWGYRPPLTDGQVE
jgi:hypothetical protein